MHAGSMANIKTILEEGKTILELGSGPGSTVGLGEIYKLYSVTK